MPNEVKMEQEFCKAQFMTCKTGPEWKEVFWLVPWAVWTLQYRLQIAFSMQTLHKRERVRLFFFEFGGYLEQHVHFYWSDLEKWMRILNLAQVFTKNWPSYA